jgi:hypothetical protein
MFLFAAVSAGFLLYGMPLPTILFLGVGLAGVGYSTRRLFLSERRRLVPGINEACAVVAILAFVLASVISIALLAWNGFSAEAIGGCILGLALSLWIGCIEKAALPVLSLFYAFVFASLPFQAALRPIMEAYTKLSAEMHVLVGLIFTTFGLGLLWRFWYITTSKYSPLIYQRTTNDSQKRWGILPTAILTFAILSILAANIYAFAPPFPERSTASWLNLATRFLTNGLFSLMICWIQYFIWNQLIRHFFPTNLKMSNVGHVLYGKIDNSSWRWIIAVYTVAFAAGLSVATIADGPEATETINDFIVAGLILLPFVAVTQLFQEPTIQFARLWISGVSQNRTQTALTILLLVVSRSLFFATLVLPFLVALGMASNLGAAPTLWLCILFLGSGALPVWVAAKFYPFWSRHQSFTVTVLLSIIGVSVVTALLNSNVVIDSARSVIHELGVVPSLVIVYASATVLWWICIWSASRSLAANHSLLECQNRFFNTIET